jgi:lipopolysaccharide export system permease protein
MGSIGRYIFRTTFGAFLLVLGSLTALIWVTQAMRDIDLMTNKGQTVLSFVAITGLIIPLLVLVIAPIALAIAVVHVLNKLSTDSEIVVMNAAGMSPWRLFRAFLGVAILVSILVTVLSAYVAPEGLRSLRRWIVAVHGDLVHLIQPGPFTEFEPGLTFHIRDRRPDGQMQGIFIDDRRTPDERSTFLAESGEVVKNASGGTFMLLESGSVQRHRAGERDPSIVTFDRYAFDLSRFAGAQNIKYSVRERYLWELIAPRPNDPLAAEHPGQFRAELHDRLSAPLYPLAFVVIVYAYLGAPRTSRQSRVLSLLGAVSAVAVLRLTGFASTVFGVQVPIVLTLQYAVLAAMVGFGVFVISRGVVLEPPAFIGKLATALTERLRLATSN